MFYESFHPLSVDYYKTLHGENITFEAHLHYCYELILVTEGTLFVTVDGKPYILRAGDGVLTFPNQTHDMQSKEYNRYVLCLFTPKLINAYDAKVASKIPISNQFQYDRFYADKLDALTKQDSVMAIKGLLYSLCDEFDKNRQYIERGNGSRYLLYDIMQFIENNYHNTCTLTELSKHLGYEYAYLSYYFKKNTGFNYSDFVNLYRINHACYLLRESDMPIMQISLKCGFNSHRSFTRNFTEQMEITPFEYRKKYVKSVGDIPAQKNDP